MLPREMRWVDFGEDIRELLGQHVPCQDANLRGSLWVVCCTGDLGPLPLQKSRTTRLLRHTGSHAGDSFSLS